MLYIITWFLAGTVGTWITILIFAGDDDFRPAPAVFLVLLGPATLVLVAVISIVIAIDSEENRNGRK